MRGLAGTPRAARAPGTGRMPRPLKSGRASTDTLAEHVQVLTLGNEALRNAVAANDTVVSPLRGNHL